MSGQVIRDVIVKVSLQNKSDGFGLSPDFKNKIDEAANHMERRFSEAASRVSSKTDSVMGRASRGSSLPARGVIPDNLQDLNARFIAAGNMADRLVKEEKAVNALMEARKRDSLTLKDSIGRGKEMVDVALQLTRGYALLGASLGVDTEKWLKYAAAAQGSMDILEGLVAVANKIPARLGGPGIGFAIGGALTMAGTTMAYAKYQNEYQKNFPKDAYSRWDGEKFTSREYTPNASMLGGMANKAYWGGLGGAYRWMGHRAVEMNRAFGFQDDYGPTAYLFGSDYKDYERQQQTERNLANTRERTMKRFEASRKFYGNLSPIDNEMDRLRRNWDMGAVATRRNNDGSVSQFSPYEHQDRVSQVISAHAARQKALWKHRDDRQRELDKNGVQLSDDAYQINTMGDRVQDERLALTQEEELLELRKNRVHELENERQRIYDNVEAMSKLVQMEKSRQDSEKRQFGHLHPAEQERAIGIAKRLKEGKQVAPWEHEFLEKIGRGDNKFTEGFFRERGKKSDELDELLGRDESRKRAERDRNDAVRNKNDSVDAIDDELNGLKPQMEANSNRLKTLMESIVANEKRLTEMLDAAEAQRKKDRNNQQQDDVRRGMQAGFTGIF